MLAAVIVTVLVVVVAAAGTLLIAPWQLDLHLRKSAASARVAVRGRLRWTFFEWEIGRTKRVAPRDRAPRAVVTRPDRDTPPSGGLAAVLAVISTPGFLARVVTLLRETLRQVWPQRVAIHARVGFDDPASTGMFIGAYQGLAAAVPVRTWTTRIEPVWDEAVIEGDVRGRWTVRVIRVLWPVMTFAASPVVWRGARAAMRARRAHRGR